MSTPISKTEAIATIRSWLEKENQTVSYSDASLLEAAIEYGLYQALKRDEAGDQFLLREVYGAYSKLPKNYERLKELCGEEAKCYAEFVSLERTRLRFSPSHGQEMLREFSRQVVRKNFGK